MKFIHSPAEPDQLYDLEADPGERVNLARGEARREAVTAFRDEVGRRWRLDALDSEVRASQRRRRLIDAALAKGEVRAWDFQPFRDAGKQYIRNSMDLDDLEAMARFRCEVVGEEGVASLPEPESVVLRRDAMLSTTIMQDWKLRFIDSYDVELQDWIEAAKAGKAAGPNAWDGYFSAVTADACLKAMHTGEVAPIVTPPRPAFYA